MVDVPGFWLPQSIDPEIDRMAPIAPRSTSGVGAASVSWASMRAPLSALKPDTPGPSKLRSLNAAPEPASTWTYTRSAETAMRSDSVELPAPARTAILDPRTSGKRHVTVASVTAPARPGSPAIRIEAVAVLAVSFDGAVERGRRSEERS